MDSSAAAAATSQHPILQLEVRAAFGRPSDGQWTTLYEQIRTDGQRGHLGRFCALSPPSRRAKVLSSPGWDLLIGDGRPGFVQYYAEGERRHDYLRYGDDDGIEPLVLRRHFHGIRPPYVELSEEFRLFHDLADAGDGTLIKIEDDGSQTVVAELSEARVRVHTSLLRQFQAARQLDLLLFIESDYWQQDEDDPVDSLLGIEEQIETETTRASFHVAGVAGPPLSRFLGKTLVPAPEMSVAGSWLGDDIPEEYPSFLLDTDDDGNPVEFSCEPDNLANYFGANPCSPHYLYPVYFKRTVLQKYYAAPYKHTVGDGYLRCSGLWALRLDNNHPEYVVVHLGDLGRDLPERERPYWRSFSVLAAEAGFSETTFRRAFLGQWADATAPDLVFRNVYGAFANKWASALGWELIRPQRIEGEHVVSGIRVPLSESEPEFKEQTLNLAIALVDSLNDAELRVRAGVTDLDMKSIAKLEKWLEQEHYPHVARDVALLRTLQSIRSKGTAHRRGADYGKLVADLAPDGHIKAVRQLLERSTVFLRDVALHFGVDLD